MCIDWRVGSLLLSLAKLNLSSCLTAAGRVSDSSRCPFPFACPTGDRWEASENNGHHPSAGIHARLNIFIYPSSGDGHNGAPLVPFHDDSSAVIHKSSMKLLSFTPWCIIRSLLFWRVSCGGLGVLTGLDIKNPIKAISYLHAKLFRQSKKLLTVWLVESPQSNNSNTHLGSLISINKQTNSLAGSSSNTPQYQSDLSLCNSNPCLAQQASRLQDNCVRLQSAHKLVYYLHKYARGGSQAALRKRMKEFRVSSVASGYFEREQIQTFVLEGLYALICRGLFSGASQLERSQLCAVIIWTYIQRAVHKNSPYLAQ